MHRWVSQHGASQDRASQHGANQHGAAPAVSSQNLSYGGGFRASA
jgi:hypothetical protein